MSCRSPDARELFLITPNGMEALSKLQSTDFDAIICDNDATRRWPGILPEVTGLPAPIGTFFVHHRKPLVKPTHDFITRTRNTLLENHSKSISSARAPPERSPAADAFVPAANPAASSDRLYARAARLATHARCAVEIM
jgi:hypothetical protein